MTTRERARKVGVNEGLFREVNERMEELNRTFAEFTDTIRIVCECADASCVQQITIPVSDYERLRSDPTHFAVVRGHEAPDVESVIEECEGYDVVRKNPGVPQQVAEATDTRS
jgi:hypothetical protein